MEEETGAAAPVRPGYAGVRRRRAGGSDDDDDVKFPDTDTDDEELLAGVAGVALDDHWEGWAGGDGPALDGDAVHRVEMEVLLAGIAAARATSHVAWRADAAPVLRTVHRVVEAGVDALACPTLGTDPTPAGQAWARTLLGIVGELAGAAKHMMWVLVAAGPPPSPRPDTLAQLEGAVFEAAALFEVLRNTPLRAAVDGDAARGLRVRWAQLSHTLRTAVAAASIHAMMHGVA